jgi:hypothetical protein
MRIKPDHVRQLVREHLCDLVETHPETGLTLGKRSAATQCRARCLPCYVVSNHVLAPTSAELEELDLLRCRVRLNTQWATVLVEETIAAKDCGLYHLTVNAVDPSIAISLPDLVSGVKIALKVDVGTQRGADRSNRHNNEADEWPMLNEKEPLPQ